MTYQINENSITIKKLSDKSSIAFVEEIIKESFVDKDQVHPKHERATITYKLRRLTKKQKESLVNLLKENFNEKISL